MSTCTEFKRKILDFIEGHLEEDERTIFEKHLRHCNQCHREYTSVKKLYETLSQDEVVLPSQQFFDNLKIKIKQKKIVARAFAIKRFIRILVPACAAAVIVLLLLNRPAPTVEFAIPTSTLLEDKEIAGLSLGAIVDDELIHDMSIIEEYLAPGFEETIDELTEEEQSEFIEMLYEKYDYDTNI